MRSRTRKLIIALVGIFGTLLLARTYEVSTHCLHDTRLIKSPPGGKYDAVVYEDACDGFGGSDVVTLRLRRNHFWPLNTSVFAYDVDGEPPVVTWLDPTHVEVRVDSIESLDDIHYQLREANGIHISYTVTQVGAPAFSPRPHLLAALRTSRTP